MAVWSTKFPNEFVSSVIMFEFFPSSSINSIRIVSLLFSRHFSMTLLAYFWHDKEIKKGNRDLINGWVNSAGHDSIATWIV